jgi:hypothetical protein
MRSLLAFLMGLVAGCEAAPMAAEDIGALPSDLITSTNTFYDGFESPATQCTIGNTTLHCCPAGQAMVGVHIDQNVFKCAPLTVPRSGVPFLDATPPTQRNGMHSCPLNSVMVGLHAITNRLLCQALAIHVSEAVDAIPTEDGFPMHVCPAGKTMSGIHVDGNLLNCASGTTDVTGCHVNSGCGSSFGCTRCTGDNRCHCGFITSCANPFSPLCQITNLCAGHGHEDPNVGCTVQP